MLREVLLICSLAVLPGCALFKTVDPVVVSIAPREALNIPMPVPPSFEKSKEIEWNLNENGDSLSISRKSFGFLMEDLIDYSKYNEKLREVLKKYQDYVDKPVEPEKK